jgi:hypothetical protein
MEQLELDEPYDEQFEHELTDERDYDEEDNPTNSRNHSVTAATPSSSSSTSDAKSSSETKPQIKMTVAADAPWRERLWEGMRMRICVCVIVCVRVID